jgi:hypothetical protein
MKKLIAAVKWEIKVNGKERSIQLFDEKNNKVKGNEAFWEGDFRCYNNQLTSLDGAPKEVGGDFSCSYNQLTTLDGAPKEIGGDFNCSYNQRTTLDGAPKEIGGDFHCYNNQLTSLDGAPKEIGGNFNCSSNQLINKSKEPNTYKKDVVRKRIFNNKLKRGYLYADGILQKLISTKKTGIYVIYKNRRIGSKKTAFVAREKDVFAHGNTIKEAVTDLRFKTSSKNKSTYEGWKLNTIVSKEDMIIAYRVITGACQFGVSEFLEGKKIPAKLSLEAAIKLTTGQYGSEQFSEFFKK